MGRAVSMLVLLGLCWGFPRCAASGVCEEYLHRFYKSLLGRNIDFTPAAIEKEFVAACRDATGKESRLCYYLGASTDSATKILNEVTRPMSAHVPAYRICEKLRKIDMQICELKYDKELDLESLDLSKMKVVDLQKILDSWGEVCRACIEKTDFVNLIRELAPKYALKRQKADF
ncbi:hypothetical protein FKM82_012890 [Ascaphus truei]